MDKMNPSPPPEHPPLTEHALEFLRELALALRRITGRQTEFEAQKFITILENEPEEPHDNAG